MTFPLTDWQFWFVTLSAAGALWMLVKPFVARSPETRSGACSGCSMASGCSRPAPSSGAEAERLVVLRGGR
jgi:hypothetical protein